jgi:hypothetical protein
MQGTEPNKRLAEDGLFLGGVHVGEAALSTAAFDFASIGLWRNGPRRVSLTSSRRGQDRVDRCLSRIEDLTGIGDRGEDRANDIFYRCDCAGSHRHQVP